MADVVGHPNRGDRLGNKAVGRCMSACVRVCMYGPAPMGHTCELVAVQIDDLQLRQHAPFHRQGPADLVAGHVPVAGIMQLATVVGEYTLASLSW